MEEYIEKKLLIEKIIEAIQDTKGEDIKLLDLTKIENSAADYFIICSANSNTQVNAIAGNIEPPMARRRNRKCNVDFGRLYIRCGAYFPKTYSRIL